jgi:hypothetical protein
MDLKNLQKYQPLEDTLQVQVQASEAQENSYKKTHPNEEAAAATPDADPMTNLGGQAAVVLLIVLVKLCAQCTGVDHPNEGEINDGSKYKLHEAFQPPFKKMMGQGTQVLFVVTLLDLVNVNVLHSGNVELVCLGGFVAYMIWVGIGSYFIYHAQNKMRVWFTYEAIAHNEEELERLQRKHRVLFHKFKTNNEVNMAKVGKIAEPIEYLILRQSFINPMHMPVMTESYLRRDFHFALYLGYCYGKMLTNLFKWSLWSTLIFFGAVVFTNLVGVILADETGMISGLLQLLVVITAFVMLMIMRKWVVNARKQLVPTLLNEEGEIADPQYFNINVNEKSIDPFEDFADIPRMPYLEMTAENTTLTKEQRMLVDQAAGDDEGEALLQRDGEAGDEEAKEEEDEVEQDPVKIPNKQESLFCCKRKGANYYVINSIEFFYIVLVAFFGYKLGSILVDQPIGMVLGIVGYILASIAWFAVMPELLDSFAMSTCIEMMKNREVINIVIRQQKFERAKRSFRIYQIFKLIRREMIIEFNKAIPDKEMSLTLKKQVMEAFLQLNRPDSAAQKRQVNQAPIIRNDLLFTLIRLCGGAKCLNREECFILMKKVHLLQVIDDRHQRQERASVQVGQSQDNHPTAFI